MEYFNRLFNRLKEIHRLQWELFIDYWYLHIALLVVGLLLVVWWILKR